MSAQNQLHRHPTACVVYTELKTVYKNPYHEETISKHAYHQCFRGCGFCLRGNSTRCSASAYLARTPNAPTTGFALLVEQPEPGLGCFNRRSMQHIETPIAFTAVSSCARKRADGTLTTTSTSYVLGSDGPDDGGAPRGAYRHYTVVMSPSPSVL